ncbi:hypothetical protein K2173_018557 [Erythroxylum novogranatense]|uniref:AB hydrolase-1 domain-containing protein n=1 Tax=Erythroxylum novogranatense TaxID=1862640 RepID=A0AAV8UB13_9ROSI|nr:hypothetical protein K2173_018557 [Erythroxylum novogranatense]
MAAGGSRKISAASARAHTRGPKQNNSCSFFSGISAKILLVFFVGNLAWAYQIIQPPPPRTCGSPGGPLVKSSRIKLRDGRHLAYKEHGVSKDTAKYKTVYIHGFDSSKHDAAISTHLSKEIVEELGVYIVSFDRPGYGESDPHPERTLKSFALDVEQLADQLGLGSKFYVIGFSMGGELTWTCLKYIPHRLAGATLLAPVVNYWWPGFPSNLSKKAYHQQLTPDQWALRVAHYAPWLSYWWNTQKWFTGSTVIAQFLENFSPKDLEFMAKETDDDNEFPRQQGEYESLHRDLNIGFGPWEFDPMDLENPFPNNEGSVHIWHGDEDRLVPVLLQRYIAKRLSWIHYHELEGMGHMFPLDHGMNGAIIRAMVKQ